MSPEAAEHRRKQAREYKRNRTGTCLDCGAQTRYAGHGVVVSKRCNLCAPKDRGLRDRGKGQRQQALFEHLDEVGEARYMSIVAHLGITKNHTGTLINHAMRDGQIVRVRRGWYARS